VKKVENTTSLKQSYILSIINESCICNLLVERDLSNAILLFFSEHGIIIDKSEDSSDILGIFLIWQTVSNKVKDVSQFCRFNVEMFSPINNVILKEGGVMIYWEEILLWQVLYC